LLKSDGYPTYHLANVVDDHLMAITHILRGDEWISTVPEHVLLYQAFGWDMPVQVHLPLILDPSGKGKLSKRKKKLADGREMLTYIHEFRRAGYLPEAMVNFLALVGWSLDGETEFLNRDELIRHFSLEGVSKSPGAFSYEKLDYMNGVYIRGLGHNDLAGRLMQVLLRAGLAAEYPAVLELVPLIRERIKTLNEAVEMVDFAFVDEITYDTALLVPKKLDRAATLAALQATEQTLAALETFTEEALEASLRGLAEVLSLKVGDLFGAIRVAVTGKMVAPPLFGSLHVLGREKTLRRLGQAVARLEAAG